MADEKNKEYLSGVLNITRDQLSRALAAAAEIEALLVMERKRSEGLESKVRELEDKLAEPAKKKAEEI